MKTGELTFLMTDYLSAIFFGAMVALLIYNIKEVSLVVTQL